LSVFPFGRYSALLALILALAGCTPAPSAPSPTTAPAKAPPAPAVASPAAQPAASPAAQPAAASPVAKPAASPANSPVSSPVASPSPSPVAAPASKPSFDEAAVADFYRGKTLTFIVGYGPGGGFDLYARLIARHIGRYIPGNPNVIVQNMPGGGSLTSINHTYNVAPKDGSVVVHFHGGNILQQFLGTRAAEFDSSKVNWIGSPLPETPACAVRKESGFTSFAQALPDGGNKELIIGGTGLDYIGNVLNLALKPNLKLVPGYEGTAQIRLAAEKGEVHGFCTAWETIRSSWQDGLSSGEVNVIVQAAREPHPELKEVPRAQDLAKTPETKQIIEYGIRIPSEVARPFGMAPEVPRDRVQAMRSAFEQALKDPQLLA
jgi:tripartite-type tricarboxylate transporter receptor subunit TctC